MTKIKTAISPASHLTLASPTCALRSPPALACHTLRIPLQLIDRLASVALEATSALLSCPVRQLSAANLPKLPMRTLAPLYLMAAEQ